MSGKVSFVTAVLNGDAHPDEIDDFVAAWHEGNECQPLHEALGMTPEEYALWVEQPDVLEFLLHSRRFGISLNRVLENREAHLLAARSAQRGEAENLITWLKRRGSL
jgi:hypothetical protein